MTLKKKINATCHTSSLKFEGMGEPFLFFFLMGKLEEISFHNEIEPGRKGLLLKKKKKGRKGLQQIISKNIQNTRGRDSFPNFRLA